MDFPTLVVVVLVSSLSEAGLLSEGRVLRDGIQQKPATVQPEVQVENITAPLEQNITVNCSVSGQDNIKAVKVTRVDLGDQYVAYLRDEQMDSDNQHPFFNGRVKLWIHQGKVFLTLQRVKSTDEGTYKIEIKYGEEKLKTKLIRTFNLMTPSASDASSTSAVTTSAVTTSAVTTSAVTTSAKTHPGVIASIVILFVGVLVVCIVNYYQKRGRRQSHEAVTNKAAGQQAAPLVNGVHH